MHPTRLLLFDIDGTLLTIEEELAFADAFKERLGIDPDLNWDRFKSNTDWGVAFELLQEHLGRTPDDAEVVDAVDLFVKFLREHMGSGRTPIVPTPGAGEFVRRAHREGHALGLATGCVLDSARAKIEPMGLNPLFPVGGFGDRRFERAELLRDALDAAQTHWNREFRPEQVCYFGDRTWDIEAARALGLHFVGVAVTPEARERLERAGAKRVIEDFAEIAAPEVCFTLA